MAVRRSDYENENGEVDWEAFDDAKNEYGDMKYQEWKDDQMEREDEEARNREPETKDN